MVGSRARGRGGRGVKLLLTTEGTYPSIMGGVSTWCDQLVRGMAEHEYHLLEVTGPLPTKPAYALSANVRGLTSVRLWTPRSGRPGKGRGSERTFARGLERLLGFAEDDIESFATGLLDLATLGTDVDLWPYFDKRSTWEAVRVAIWRTNGEAPPMAEVALAVNWLKGTLGPLLFIPPHADQAHTTSNGLSAIPAWLVAKAYGVPLMLTEHGLYLRERYLSLTSEENPPGLKLLRSRFYYALARMMYQEADLIVSVSEFNRTWQIELGAPAERTRVVYNGVAPEAFPVATTDTQSRPTVSWVGRIDPIKDLETLVRSFTTVTKSAPEAKLKLFGPVPKGNEEYDAKVKGLVRDLDLGGSVTFEGPVKPVHHAYHAADVVALSSISEGFPYVAIEAMMCGRPVVATQVGGVGEAVGDFGRMVDPRSPDELGAALTELLVDVPLRRRLGVGARERALQLFTLSRMYDGYRGLYGELGVRARKQVRAV